VKILIIGGGRMGEAFAFSLIKSGNNDVFVAEPDSERRQYLNLKLNVNISKKLDVYDQINELLPITDTIILCIKPQLFPEISKRLKGIIDQKKLVISILAGTKLNKICESLQIDNAVRAMPNTPGQIGKGISIWKSQKPLSANEENQVAKILECLGIAIKTDKEADIDKATAISGSGPGYLFLIMEIMEDIGIELGLSKEVVKKLVIETFVGSSILAKEKDKSFKELREEVTSPNGTTDSGIKEMMKNKLDLSIKSGIIKAHEKSIEISND
tara:strand:- start:3245 stop:4057 length:813 start_codon:yes stop_codon:yes gene_type:complete